MKPKSRNKFLPRRAFEPPRPRFKCAVDSRAAHLPQTITHPQSSDSEHEKKLFEREGFDHLHARGC